MFLTRLAIRRPLTMLMLIVALAIMGARSLSLLQVDRFPRVDFPVITVSVAFPGASPEDVESLILEPIEDVVVGLPGVDSIQAIANEGVGFVVIQFQETVDGNTAAIDVERQVAAVQLPDDATDPSIFKFDFNAIPIMEIIITGPQSQDELARIARDDIAPRLQSVQGVASVDVFGGREELISVEADPRQLAAYNLTLGALQQTFGVNNLTFPVGNLSEGSTRSSVRSVGNFEALSQIESMVVSGGAGGPGGGGAPAPAGSDSGGQVYLRDVATVERGFEDVSVIQRFNGRDTVAISIIKTTDANTIDVADDLLVTIDRLNRELPVGAEMIVVNDDSQFVRNSVAAVQEDLILAILVTGLFMLIFLHTIRSTFIVIISIPVALISTFTVMYALGFTLNILTLLALTLVIGILVDDSIVVVENTERHLRMGKTSKEAAHDGRGEIALAGLSITMVDVIVYLPIAFTSGIVGQFFQAYGITIASVGLISLFASFTLAPLLAAYLLKARQEDEDESPRGVARYFTWLTGPIGWVWRRFVAAWEAGFVALSNAYARLVALTLRNVFTQLLTFGLAVALLIVTAVTLGPRIGFEFIPTEDNGRITISVQMPPGTELGRTDQVARQIEQTILTEVPETVNILTRVGSGGGGLFGGGGGDTSGAQISLTVVNKNDRERGAQQIVNELRPLVSDIPDALVTLSAGVGFGPGGSPIQVQVSGPEQEVLIDLADQIAEIMRDTPGTVDVVNNDAARSPELRIELDRERLIDLGLSPAQVATTLRTAIVGADVGDFEPQGERTVEINLRVQESSREDLNALLQLPIGYSNGAPVLLAQVASIERSLAPATISRIDRQRVLSIGSSATTNDIGGISTAIEERVNQEVVFPPEYEFTFGGDIEQQQESFAQLGGALLLSFALIYILLVALYQNFLQPLAIMFSLPMSWIGVFVGLYLSQNTFNIFSILGVIVLTGLVSRNAILIIDFANQLQANGMTRKASLIEAGRLRLRPVTMTAGTLVVALMPVLLSTADGSESRTPLAAVLMGGAVTAGAMTLLVVPVVYNFFEWLSDLLKQGFAWVTGSNQAEAAPETSTTGSDAPSVSSPAEVVGR